MTIVNEMRHLLFEEHDPQQWKQFLQHIESQLTDEHDARRTTHDVSK